jgi:hypothetical protein
LILKEVIEKYENSPEKFIEEYFGMKLYLYQKIMLKSIIKKGEFKWKRHLWS